MLHVINKNLVSLRFPRKKCESVLTASTRRSYLFYGVPGAGKTSFIQAIAGHCSRSISYLQIDPEMTDVILRSAMEVPTLIRPILSTSHGLFAGPHPTHTL